MAMHGHLTRRSFLAGSLAAGSMGMGRMTPAESSRQREAPVRTRSEWQIGCYTRPWDQFEYRVALDAIAEAGFKHVGLMTAKSMTNLVISALTTPEEAQRVAVEVRRRGLKVLSVYGGELPASQGVDAASSALRKLVDNCALVGSSTLLMGGVGDQKQYDAYYKAIAVTCDYAAGKHVGITLKPHGGLNATGPQCRKAIEKVGHRNFKLWYDPGNIFYYSDGRLDPVDDAASVDGLVTGMCVKDFLLPKNVAVTPGGGKVNFPAVLARLKRGGFVGGPLVVEMLAPAADRPGIIQQAQKARLFVEKLVREV